MAMGAVTSGGIGTQLAQQGLKAMFGQGVTGIQDQARIGDSYISNIASQSTDTIERALSKTALHVTDYCNLAKTQAVVASATLNALAAGVVGGSLGSVLAHVGTAAFYSQDTPNIHEQASIGLAFAEGVRDNTTDAAQRASANAAIQTALQVSNVRSQAEVLGAFLSGIN